MKLVVGLGNPGDEYNFTRHNFGFLALDFYAKLAHFEWEKPKFGALWYKSSDTILLKPQDFYNNSGQAVQKFAHFYKITPTDILVLCDDFNLPFGTLRFREKGSDGGNNGLKSVTAHLGTPNFPRLRLGTGNPTLHQQLGDVEFVLGRFTSIEKEQLPIILQNIITKMTDLTA